MQDVFEKGATYKAKHIAALDRNLKIAEQGGLVERWLPGGVTRPFDDQLDALPLVVVAQLSKLLLACVTLPSDDLERCVCLCVFVCLCVCVFVCVCLCLFVLVFAMWCGGVHTTEYMYKRITEPAICFCLYPKKHLLFLI